MRTENDQRFNRLIDELCVMGPIYRCAATIILLQCLEQHSLVESFCATTEIHNVISEAEEIIEQFDRSARSSLERREPD